MDDNFLHILTDRKRACLVKSEGLCLITNWSNFSDSLNITGVKIEFSFFMMEIFEMADTLAY